jgi:hypothetical protein
MTLAAIILPRWVRWESVRAFAHLPSTLHMLQRNKHDHADVVCLQDLGGDIKYSYGLSKRCSTVTGTCEPFPTYKDCELDSTFCAMWRSVGFLMSFTVIIELATFIAYTVVILGGVQQRSYGWKIVCSLLGLASTVQLVCMALIV